MKANNRFPFFIVGAMLIFGLLAYPALPEQVQTHWDINGEANGWSSKLSAILTMPAILMIVHYAMATRRFAGTTEDRRDTTSETWMQIENAIFVVLGLLYVIAIGTGLGWEFPKFRLMVMMIGVLYAFIGNLSTRLEPNWVIGIRFPWTVRSREVWRKTHRTGGRSMVLVGVLIMLGGVFLPLPIAGTIMLILFIAHSLVLGVWSYRIAQRTAAQP